MYALMARGLELFMEEQKDELWMETQAYTLAVDEDADASFLAFKYAVRVIILQHKPDANSVTLKSFGAEVLSQLLLWVCGSCLLF